MPMLSKGQWSGSLPGEVHLIMQDDGYDWDWQIRTVNDENWFVARIGQKTIAGRVAAEVETPPLKNTLTIVDDGEE